MLGLKFTDRTFRFAHLLQQHDGLRLTSAGAGLIPFTSMDRGIIRSDGIGPLTEVLDRALDREEVERGGAVVVLDGRVAVRTHLPLPDGPPPDDDEIGERVSWELGTRFGGSEPSGDLHVEWALRSVPGGTSLVDAWGVPRSVLGPYEEVVEGVGCRVDAWDCDQWALARLARLFTLDESGTAAGGGGDGYGARSEGRQAVVHVEADSLEINVGEGDYSIGVTSLRRENGGGSGGAWESDEPDAVAAEVERALEELKGRWSPAGPAGETPLERVWFTGSVESPDLLLAALVRNLRTRVEMIDITTRLTVDETLAASPLIESNLGSFALSIGGALTASSP